MSIGNKGVFISVCAPHMHTEASVSSRTLKAQKYCETGTRCVIRWPRYTQVTPNVPKRGPLWIWIRTVCADLVLQVLPPYELLKSFLCDCLVHQLRMGWKIRVEATTCPAIILSALSYALLNSITNLSTPILSYFSSTLWSLFSRSLRRLQLRRFSPSPCASYRFQIP